MSYPDPLRLSSRNRLVIHQDFYEQSEEKKKQTNRKPLKNQWPNIGQTVLTVLGENNESQAFFGVARLL